MKTVLSVLGVFWLCSQVQAITWDFDEEGNTQGWVVQDAVGVYGAAPLRSEVHDGVWRITPGVGANWNQILMTSPLIQRDSALFDRLRVHLRMVGTRAFTTSFALWWRNSTNMEYRPGQPPPREPKSEYALLFERYTFPTFTTDWQEVDITNLRTEESTSWQGERLKVLWEGELLDLAVAIMLTPELIQPPGEVPEAVEIDWIQLTGVEEQMQGEENPPGAEGLTAFGTYYAPPLFSPLGHDLASTPWVPMAGLGDLDGDRDLDLVAPWRGEDNHRGWLTAVNEGEGRFVLRSVESDHDQVAFIFYLGVADVDGDGLVDVVVRHDTSELRLLRNGGEQGWTLAQVFPEMRYVGLGDADGDGDVDLWTLKDSYDELRLWFNDGQGRFDQSLALGPDLFARGFSPFMPVSHLRQGLVTGFLWCPPVDDPGQGYEVTYLEANGEVVQVHLAVTIPPRLVRYAGDFDQDGDVDLVVSRRERTLEWVGLDLLVNPGDGELVRVPWQDEVVVPHDVQFFDLNGDAVLDPVFVDTNTRGPAVIVSLGQKEGVPVPEGRYPLEGVGGMMLGGDVDGDGDLDLVVLEAAPLGGGGGGVHVLLNQRGKGITVVLEEGGAQPAIFHLGSNYPNPFNPQTWIPLEVPGSEQPVQLRVYNVLGQPVRTLVDGRLGGGPHVVPWDGRDSRGQEVSSGTYLYRLQMGSQQATGKMVKSE